MTNLDSILKSRGSTLLMQVHIVKALVFPVVLYGYETWTIKKAECQRIDAFKLWCWRRLESPLDSKEIKPINSEGNQPWIFIGRADASYTLPTWCKELTHWKRPDAGKDWGQEEKWVTEDEMVGWHSWLSGHEFEQTQGDSEGQGSPAWCNSWNRKESDMT